MPDKTVVYEPRFGVRHGTSTKVYGNLSPSRNPDHRDFMKGYGGFTGQLGINTHHRVVLPNMGHSANVAQVQRASSSNGLTYIHTGSPEVVKHQPFPGVFPPEIDEVQRVTAIDAVVTDSPGVFLGMATADCAPLFLYDPRMKVIGLVHVGVFGYLGDIIRNTFRCMLTWYGSNPADVRAYVGPCITRDTWDIRTSGAWGDIYSRAKKMTPDLGEKFDLKSQIHLELLRFKLKPNNIWITHHCTGNSRLFYSHSQSDNKPNEGRILSLIGL